MRSAAFLPAVCALAASSLAQGPPLTTPLFRALEEPVGLDAGPPIIAGDFDGDGDQDLVCARGMQINNRHGRFTALPGSPPFSYFESRGIAAGDLNGDGTPDLVGIYALGANGGVRAFLNGGNGLMTPLALAPAPQIATLTVTGLALGDVDGDADPDLFLSVATPLWHGVLPGTPRLWLNDGAGNFTDASTQLPAVPVHPRVVFMLDYDVDGDQDIVVLGDGNQSSARVVLRNNGAGNFSNPVTSLGSAPAVLTAALGDFDGDGLRDLALEMVQGTFGTEVQLVRPGGVFATWFTPFPSPASALATLDTNGDGRDDLVRFGYQATTLHPVSGTGAVAPAIQSAPLDWTTAASPRIVAGDLDADGDVDLAIQGVAAPRILLNTGQGAIVEYTSFITGPWSSIRAASDLDGDGAADITGLPSMGGAFKVCAIAGDGSGGFRPSPAPPCATTSGIINDWQVFDADADGDQDLFTAGWPGYVPGEFFLWSGGTWTLATSLPGLGYTWTIKGGDLDGDGDTDLVLARSDFLAYSTTFYPSMVLLNAGGGALWVQVPLPAYQQFAADVALADADGDGDLDIFESNDANWASPLPQGVLRLNQGAGSFVASPVAGSGPAAGVAAGDLDGDGDTDCIFGARVVRNTGGGTFSAAGQLPGGDPGRVTLADVDLDGDLDVVASHQWSANLGGLVFGPPEAFAGAAGPVSVPTGVPNRMWPAAPEVLDVDGDGDLDVMSRSVRLFSNTLRHLARGNLARPGRLASLEVFGPAGTPFALAASAAPASVPLGAAGTLLIDPTSIAYATTGVLGPSGTAKFGVAVPPITALVGGTVYWQAWVPASGRLTNLEAVTIVNP